MGWGKETRLRVFKAQGGLCEYCLQPMTIFEMVLHHFRNRCQSGSTTFENARGRHTKCEQLAHSLHRYGNPGQPTHSRTVKYSKKELSSHRRKMRLDEQYAWKHYCRTGKLA